MLADIENDGILGMDFLTTHHCDLMLTQQCLKIKGEKIRCFANSRNAQSRCFRVDVSEYTEIPPATEIVVEGFATSTIDRNANFYIKRDCWWQKL